MKIEIGKYYRNRRGEKVGPIVGNSSPTYPFRADDCGAFGQNGKWLVYMKEDNDNDLIAEWTDEVDLEAQTIEAITAWAKDRTVLIQGSDNGADWSINGRRDIVGGYKYYRLAPDPLDEIAPGHNPYHLSVHQIGSGVRTLSAEEHEALRSLKSYPTSDIQGWFGVGWVPDCNGCSPSATYRTQRPPGYFLPKPEPARYTVEEIASWLVAANSALLSHPDHGIAAVVARKEAAK